MKGFDVPEFPKVSLIGIITPMSVDEDSLEYLLPFSIVAMDTFNEEKSIGFVVVVCLFNYFLGILLFCCGNRV